MTSKKTTHHGVSVSQTRYTKSRPILLQRYSGGRQLTTIPTTTSPFTTADDDDYGDHYSDYNNRKWLDTLFKRGVSE